MPESKNVLLRLDPALHQRVAAIAEIDGSSVSDVLRVAVAEHVARRQADPAFSAQVRASVRRHAALLKSLTEDEQRDA